PAQVADRAVGITPRRQELRPRAAADEDRLRRLDRQRRQLGRSGVPARHRPAEPDGQGHNQPPRPTIPRPRPRAIAHTRMPRRYRPTESIRCPDVFLLYPPAPRFATWSRWTVTLRVTGGTT